MCGIAGIVNFGSAEKQPDEELLLSMLFAIRHRGPDECGVYLDPQAGLGNVRLSIIGVSSGAQPISNEDGSLWIAYNGEAFNYIELRQELVERGHRFKTNSDTEVVLHLFEDHGPGCLAKINGQFALAIWNRRRRELFLARDRIGIRPLFYWARADRFLFASEIKAVFQDPCVNREIDPAVLAQVFTCWAPLPGRSLFKGVSELKPGHFMIVKGASAEQERFWSIPYYPPSEHWQGSVEEAGDHLRDLLRDAVRLRLRAEVPVGAYLSGGLDSSITAALIARYFNNRLKTFSISFAEPEFDESRHQQLMVDGLKTEHRQVLANNRAIRNSFPETVWHCEQPLLRTAPAPLFILSDMVRQNGFKVVLTGEGADEIFGGYNIFKEAKVREFWARMPGSRIRPLLLQRLYPYVFKSPARASSFLQRFFGVTAEDLRDPFFSHRLRWENTGRNRMFFSDSILEAVHLTDPLEELMALLPAGFAGRETLSRAQFLETAVFLSSYLLSAQGDRVAMGHSLEIRLPFLDYRVIDFAARLPLHWKINGLNEKYILKRSFAGLVPAAVCQRPKQPYRAPIRPVFFGGEPCDYVDDLLSPTALRKAGIFNEQKVGRLVAKYRSPSSAGSEVQDMAVAGILSTQLLHHQFIEDFPRRRPAPIRPDKVVRESLLSC
jgi:asparagine synthase (glutamine-hydrolysing)